LTPFLVFQFEQLTMKKAGGRIDLKAAKEAIAAEWRALPDAKK
jgi:hypothetical protein